jgi:hypothetical protein
MRTSRQRTISIGDSLILIAMTAAGMASLKFTWYGLSLGGGYFRHWPV